MRVEWITVGMIGLAYSGWVLAGWLIWPVIPWLALAVMAVLTALHSSLVHEVVHGHPTRNRTFNELMVGASLALIWPYRRFRALHLKHHHDAHLTDPFEDPESYYRALWQVQMMPRLLRSILRLNNTMAGRVIIGPVLGSIALIAGDIAMIRAGDRKVLHAWLYHLLGVIPVLVLVIWVFAIPVWLYLLTVVWGGLGLISIRTFAEHRWFETVEGRTIIVEKTPFAWLFLNNNLHIVHHKHPAAPWYELPELYRKDRDYWARLNGGYVFRNYAQMFRSYGFRQKEWVDHPALYASPAVAPNAGTNDAPL